LGDEISAAINLKLLKARTWLQFPSLILRRYKSIPSAPAIIINLYGAID
jgi:hypothetical protein